MTLVDAIIESWDRQARIVSSVASLVVSEDSDILVSPNGTSLHFHLAHIHKVRHYFLGNVAPKSLGGMADGFLDGWETPVENLDEIKRLLDDSALAVKSFLKHSLSEGESNDGKVGWYDHPVMFLQHLMWHEGWHVGMILLGLREAGLEPSEEWEEMKIWSQWRNEI